MAGATKLMTAGGGGVNLQPASSIASDVTVQVPAQNCVLGIQGPAFSARKSSTQNLTAGVFTKIQFETEEFDTASCYDNSSTYRFTPNVAGYYQVTLSVAQNGAGTAVLGSIYKNGAEFKRTTSLSASAYAVQGAALIYLNGTTDYVEGYALFGVNAGTDTGQERTYFQAILVRAA